MKTKDLMIGDYVQVSSSMTPIKVAAVHHKKLAYHACINKLSWVRQSLLEPISLTPEILEKNGWIKDLYSVESYDNEELECLSLWVGEDGKNKWWWHVGVELVTPINYVHELQHALRLCGIKKEIIL